MPSPQRIRWAKFRSTVLAAVAVAILSVLVYLLSGGTWLKAKSYIITYLPDSTGLAPGADVQLNGVQIGTVEWVRLTLSRDPNRVVEARLKIESVYLPYIPDDSVTGLDSANLLGDQYLNITMGKSPRAVREGGTLPYRPPSNIVENIDLAQFDAQLRIIDRTIIDIQAGKGSLGQFIVSDALYQKFLDGIGQVEQGMRDATATQSRLGQVLYGASWHDNLAATLRQLDNRIAQLQASRLFRDTSQYDPIREQMAKLHRTLADLNGGQGAGGRFLTSDAAYADWNRRVAAWIERLDALNDGEAAGGMLANTQTYESLDGALRDLAGTVKDFRQHPKKYLRLKIF